MSAIESAARWLESTGDVSVAGNSVHDWLVGAALIFSGVILSRVARVVLAKALPRLTALTSTDLDDQIATGSIGPLAAMVLLPFFELTLHALHMPDGVRQVGSAGVLVAFDALLLVIVLRAVDVLFQSGLTRWVKTAHAHVDLGIVELGRKATKFTVALLFIITALKSVGFDVVSLITGLGIGGLAVALAAQETLGNFLGSVQILTDQPFSRGQFVRVGNVTGRVDDIGMRSTKILTSSGVRVVLPNKQLAVEAIENLSVVNGLTIEVVIGLVYQASAEQLALACDLLREIVRGVDGTHDDVRVHFIAFNAYSLDLRLVYFVTDLDHHLDVRHAVNMAIKARFDGAGLSFAYPTQTLHVEPVRVSHGDAGPRPAP